MAPHDENCEASSGQRPSTSQVPVERAAFLRNSLSCQLLDAMQSLALVLNHDRRIVFVNRTAREILGLPEDAIVGQRIGHLFGCVHCQDAEDDCGTTEFCGTCGGAAAFNHARSGHLAVHECRIRVDSPGKDLDLQVRATPFEDGGHNFILFAAVDVSHEIRRRTLERIFFHDVLNTATAVQGVGELMYDAGPQELIEYPRMLSAHIGLLVNEICSQRDLSAHEAGHLFTQPSEFRVEPLLRDLLALYRAHAAARGKTLRLAGDLPDVSLITDRTFLARVMANLIKNALEAERSGAGVTIRYWQHERDEICLSVHNPAVMPRSVQLQVFHRSFSTKGAGRGLGTYSVDILTRQYLGGRVSFTSEVGHGTEFRVTIPRRPPGAATRQEPTLNTTAAAQDVRDEPFHPGGNGRPPEEASTTNSR